MLDDDAVQTHLSTPCAYARVHLCRNTLLGSDATRWPLPWACSTVCIFFSCWSVYLCIDRLMSFPWACSTACILFIYLLDYFHVFYFKSYIRALIDLYVLAMSIWHCLWDPAAAAPSTDSSTSCRTAFSIGVSSSFDVAMGSALRCSCCMYTYI